MSKPRKRTYVGPWCRIYAANLNNATFQGLSDEAQLAWYKLSELASLTNGVLPDPKQIAFSLRMGVHEIDGLIEVLIEGGFVIQSARSTELKMADWECRQFASDMSSERMKKLRTKRHGDTSRDDDVTSHSPSHVTQMPSSSSQVREIDLSGSTLRITAADDIPGFDDEVLP